MNTATARRRRPVGPSTRYPTLATDGQVVIAGSDRQLAIDGPHELVAAARQLAAGAEAICWVHRDALERWELPTSPGRITEAHDHVFGDGRRQGTAGWLIFDGEPKLHLAFPAYGKDFAGAGDVRTLANAVEAWRQHVGMAYVFSNAATIHKVITTMSRVGPAPDEPELPDYDQPAWAFPTNHWGVESLDVLAAVKPWVRVFDRSGSYLAAWRGTVLPDGGWRWCDAGKLEQGPESRKPPGYWLIDADELPDAGGLFPPWRRHRDGPLWVTTPMAQLITELAGDAVPYRQAYVATATCRALDVAGERLGKARSDLAGDDREAAQLALAALKRGYARATAWFERGPEGSLHRPAWRRTVIERNTANVYRALAKATPAPFALSDIDAALFALDGPDELPADLRIGTELGAWKPKGRAIPMAEAAAAYATGGPHAVVALAEGR